MKENYLAEIIIKSIEKVGDIKRDGIIITCNERDIEEILQLHVLDKEELIELRNMLVKELSNRIEAISIIASSKEDEFERIEKEHALMTVITGIIDKNYYRR